MRVGWVPVPGPRFARIVLLSRRTFELPHSPYRHFIIFTALRTNSAPPYLADDAPAGGGVKRRAGRSGSVGGVSNNYTECPTSTVSLLFAVRGIKKKEGQPPVVFVTFYFFLTKISISRQKLRNEVLSLKRAVSLLDFSPLRSFVSVSRDKERNEFRERPAGPGKKEGSDRACVFYLLEQSREERRERDIATGFSSVVPKPCAPASYKLGRWGPPIGHMKAKKAETCR